ncbi:MAG: glycosyltransferase family 4 protein [Solirubrobacterales bacterium]
MADARRPLRVAVVAEYYPRPSHPGRGIWAHRQAIAVRDHDVEPSVLALDRPIPPLHALRSLAPRRNGRPTMAPLREWLSGARSLPRRADLDEVEVRYVRFLAPPRPTSYASWGRWAARPLGRALSALEASWPFDLVHAHYAVPAGDAVLRWRCATGRAVPLVVSVHGGDLSYVAARSDSGRAVAARVLRSAQAVIVNSELTKSGVEALTGELDRLEVVHLGADVVPGEPAKHEHPTLVTVATLEPRKNQERVIGALVALRERHPQLRYVIVGQGPDRERLEQLASRLDVIDRVTFVGEVSHERALAEMARCHLHVMPSRDEPFGVAHVEAMAAGLPAIAGAGTGAQDIAAVGEGIVLVGPGDDTAIARAIDRLISDPTRRNELGAAARETVRHHFTWELCGARTAAIYRELAAAR